MDLIQVSDTPGMQVLEDEFIALKPLCDALGIDHSSQLAKLKTRSWAVMGKIPTTASDGKTYQMTALHKDSVPMWLATLSENKVNPQARQTLITYQREATKALNDYFNKKTQPTTQEPNPHPEITRQKILQEQLTTLNHAAHFIDQIQIQAQAWKILQQLEPTPPATHKKGNTLTITDYLRSRHTPETNIPAIRADFAHYLIKEYTQTHGHKPKRRHGQYRYTTNDRPLMDAAYQKLTTNPGPLW